MSKIRWQQIRANDGFSLIELLAIAAILILLSTFSLPVYERVTDRVRLSRSLADLREIEVALERYRAEVGYYPPNLGTLRDKGFFKRHVTFESPWSSPDSRLYYFYAVDTKERALAYVLGDPGPKAKCSGPGSATLYQANDRPLPCGFVPTAQARFWLGSDNNLTLSPEPAERTISLTGYRKTCTAASQPDIVRAVACSFRTES